MRILGIERDKSACNFYRILQPLTKLDELKLAEVFILNEGLLGGEAATNAALWADIIVFQRPATEEWFRFIKTCQKYGKLIVSDYDDDPFNTSPLNSFYGYIGTEEVLWQWADGTKEMLWSDGMKSASGNTIFSIEKNINHRDMFRLNFKKSDMVTTTTEQLRSEFLKLNPNVAVLPNLVSKSFFPDIPDFNKREVRIGWQGGSSHYEDLYFIKPVIKNILDKFDSVKFVYFGDYRFMGLFKDCDQNKIEFHPWVSHATYPFKLALLNLDIGLCPLVDNLFNRNKSAIKWMEYSMMGITTIAADIPPYSPVIRNQETGVLCAENHEDWESAISELIKNEGRRKVIARNAKEEVECKHNAETSAKLWVQAYESILRPKTSVLE